jgi:hypothetical protein
MLSTVAAREEESLAPDTKSLRVIHLRLHHNRQRRTLRTALVHLLPLRRVVLVVALHVEFTAIFELNRGTLLRRNRELAMDTDHYGSSLFPHERTPFPDLCGYITEWSGPMLKSLAIFMQPGAWPTRHWISQGFPGLAAFSSSIPLLAGDRTGHVPTESAFWDQIPAKPVPRSRTSLEHADRCRWWPSNFVSIRGLRRKPPQYGEGSATTYRLASAKVRHQPATAVFFLCSNWGASEEKADEDKRNRTSISQAEILCDPPCPRRYKPTITHTGSGVSLIFLFHPNAPRENHFSSPQD